MQTSCLLIIISVFCFIIHNESFQAEASTGSQPQINLEEGSHLCPEPKICVHFNHCLANGTLNTGGANMLSTKINKVILLNGTRASICSEFQVCCESDKYPNPSVSNDTNVFKGCGISNTNGIDLEHKTNDSRLSQYGEFPWTVALLRHYPSPRQRELMCGGSLIHPNVVLTAAHCVFRTRKPKESFKVRAGEWDTSSTAGYIPFQERNVSEIIVHEHFHHPTFTFDVALLILTEPFIFDSNIQTICLASPDSNSDDQQQCYASGWGDQVFPNATLPTTIMKKVELSVVPRAICQTELKETVLGPYFRVHTSFMCARGVDQNACTADGGGPLVCLNRDGSNRYYQAGIIAAGIECNQIHIPRLYADIAKHRNWIDDKMRQNNFSTEYYIN